MHKEEAGTNLHVDKELCIGCGICVDACPMKVLDVQDRVCILVDGLKCLECGSCVCECPKNALSVKERISEETQLLDKQAVKKKRRIEFIPLMEELNALIQELNPVQVYESKGEDIRDLDDFEIEGERCYGRLYQAEKVEKIGVACMNFFGLMNTTVITIRPSHEYDIPIYSMDWSESEGHIFLYCDLLPSDDPGRNLSYLTNYLYAPLEDLYQTYSTLPELKNSVFHWVRAISSPYNVTGTIKKKSRKSVDMIRNCARDYLKAWIALCREAKPQDPHSEYMKRIGERRNTIGKLLHENDPGLGPLNKFLGDEKARVAMSIVEP